MPAERKTLSRIERAERIMALQAEAEAAYEQRRWAVAAEKYRAVLALDSNSAIAKMGLAKVGLKMREAGLDPREIQVDEGLPATARLRSWLLGAFRRAGLHQRR